MDKWMLEIWQIDGYFQVQFITMDHSVIILSVQPFPIILSDPFKLKVNNIIQALMGTV